MDLKTKVKSGKLLRGKYAQLPAVFLEEQSMDKSKSVDVHYGSNYSCVVILPVGVKVGDKQKERISNLLNEPLDTQR